MSENESMRNDSTKEDVELLLLKKTLSDERMKKEQVSGFSLSLLITAHKVFLVN